MAFRLDKYVWSVRLAKTRSLATEAISKGKVKLNGQQVKPSRDVKVGDVINVAKNTAIYSYKICQLIEKRIGPKLVEQYLLDITPEEEIEKYKVYNLSQSFYRENGSGKPTKKDRRSIDKFLDF
jgi:ribosome-associated heat shock protein Hsp15